MGPGRIVMIPYAPKERRRHTQTESLGCFCHQPHCDRQRLRRRRWDYKNRIYANILIIGPHTNTSRHSLTAP